MFGIIHATKKTAVMETEKGNDAMVEKTDGKKKPSFFDRTRIGPLTMRRALLTAFIVGLLLRGLFIFTILPSFALSNIPADYGAGVAQLIGTGIFQFTPQDIDIMHSVDMRGFPYTTYWPYLPFTNYFRGALVLLSGHDIAVFDAFYVLLIVLSDVLICMLIQKILMRQGLGETKSTAAGLLYFLNPMTFDNLRWRSTNNFMVLFLVLALYLYVKYDQEKAHMTENHNGPNDPSAKQKLDPKGKQMPGPWAATSALGLGIAMKILPVFVLPAVLLKELPEKMEKASANQIKKVIGLGALALTLALVTAIPTLLYDAPLFLKNSFLWGGGVHGGNLSDSVQFISFLTLLNVAGFAKNAPAFIGTLFIGVMLLAMLWTYFRLRHHDLAVNAFAIFAIFFLLHNIIETHHFVMLYALFALVVFRSERLQKWALLFSLLPILWYFATPTAFGSRLLAKIGLTHLPHGLIVIGAILIIKAGIFLVLQEAFKLKSAPVATATAG